MKKRILVFHPTIAPYRIDFFNDLYGAFDMRVCLLYRNLKSQSFDYEKIMDQLCFVPAYLKNILKIGKRSIYGGYWRQLRDFQPDIVVVGEFDLGTLAVLAYKYLFFKHFKIVSICDDSYNMVAEGNDFSFLHRLARKLVTPMLDDLVLVEPKVVKWYQDYYNKGFWFPIIKKDETARLMYERLTPRSIEVARKWNVNDKNVFLFVGRLINLKNVKTIIEAFSKINQKDNVLVIIGDGPEKSALQKQANALRSNIIFLGRLEGDELNLWYNIANCFILASYQEAFGAVTNEALLAGCWCLISNKAGSSCLIEEGVNGNTFDPMDVDDLARKMELSISHTNDVAWDIRNSRMLITYQERMHELIEHLENL